MRDNEREKCNRFTVPSRCLFRFQTLDGEAPTTLYAASGRPIPAGAPTARFGSKSPSKSQQQHPSHVPTEEPSTASTGGWLAYAVLADWRGIESRAALKQRFECLYKRNVPSQNIEELRKFVDASLGQDKTNPC